MRSLLLLPLPLLLALSHSAACASPTSTTPSSAFVRAPLQLASSSATASRHQEADCHALPTSDEAICSVEVTEMELDRADSVAAFATPNAEPSTARLGHHHSHAAPLAEIDEDEILLHHQPDSYAYFQFDGAETGQRGLLLAHVAFMILAFFVFLPLSLFLKAASSKLARIPHGAFLATTLLGTLFGTFYKGATPELYAGNFHSPLGWVIVALVLALNAVDFVRLGRRLARRITGGRSQATPARRAEETSDGDGDKDDEGEALLVASPVADERPRVETATNANWTEISLHTTRTGKHRRTDSALSDETLFDSVAPDQEDAGVAIATGRAGLRARLATAARVGLTVLERSLVVLAWAQVLSGTAVYFGACRGTYINGCMAHTIKGSIFLWYGLLTFARYLGMASSLGWAWNRRPRGDGRAWSAEFVESLVIFVYGITQTWLERLGSDGDPYSVKDVQHISIAVMFWFAGGLGMLLESRVVRSWLSQPAVVASGRKASEISEPPSANFSFNPFPALVIGVTGVAMSAHHQTYQFQVEIHALWGSLLGLFAVFRILTYLFLFLRPPASILPSRPPTEALASVCLVTGGIVFILSTEQVTFAAMRHQFDDVMMVLNFSVALGCILLTWVLALFALKGWAIAHSLPASENRSPPGAPHLQGPKWHRRTTSSV